MVVSDDKIDLIFYKKKVWVCDKALEKRWNNNHKFLKSQSGNNSG